MIRQKISQIASGEGKPVVALHHSICAFDDWPEYWNIIGGKYFHKATTFKGKIYEPCSYIHDLHFNVKISDENILLPKDLKILRFSTRHTKDTMLKKE